MQKQLDVLNKLADAQPKMMALWEDFTSVQAMRLMQAQNKAAFPDATGDGTPVATPGYIRKKAATAYLGGRHRVVQEKH
jgi:hypothetical protein